MRRPQAIVTVVATLFSLAVPAVAQPDNDDLGNAADIEAVPFDTILDTSEATTESEEPVEGDELCPPRGSTVWYALTLDTSQRVRIETAGSDYDTTLAVYTGSDYTDLALVECIDDTILGSLQAALTFDATAEITYLIQVGSVGGDGGGNLVLSVAEPATAPAPLVIKGKFKGLAAEAFTEEVDEETGAPVFTSAFLIDGQSLQDGKIVKFSELGVSRFTEVLDEETGDITFTDWFGFVDLERSQFAIHNALKSAQAETEVVLDGIQCTGNLNDDQFDCVTLGSVNVEVDLSWVGQGPTERSNTVERSSEDGNLFLFRSNFFFREADVEGGLSGGFDVDFDTATGTITRQNFGDLMLIRELP